MKIHICTLKEQLSNNSLNIDDKINHSTRRAILPCEKMNNKINKINILKDKFYLLINKQFEDNVIVNDINKHLNDCKELYQFSNIMKIYEYNKWNKLKLDYSNIKKKLTLYKKTYIKMIKMYTNIINYFNQDEICIFNDKIKFLQNENQIINYNCAILCRKHLEFLNKCKYLIKNNQVIKIYNSNNSDTNCSIELIIKKMYELYYKIKQLNKQNMLLKITKNNINNEIICILKKQKSFNLAGKK